MPTHIVSRSKFQITCDALPCGTPRTQIAQLAEQKQERDSKLHAAAQRRAKRDERMRRRQEEQEAREQELRVAAAQTERDASLAREARSRRPPARQ